MIIPKLEIIPSLGQWIVIGGVYTDFQFNRIREEDTESYGPFENYDEAYAAWKAKVWLNVDNALHRLHVIQFNGLHL